MTFYKLFLYQKFNSFEKNKYNPIPQKFEVNVCFALKASSICYFFAITERTTLLRRLKKQLLWPRKQTSTQCFVRHWWMNASLGIVEFEIVSLFLKLIQKFIYIHCNFHRNDYTNLEYGIQGFNSVNLNLNHFFKHYILHTLLERIIVHFISRTYEKSFTSVVVSLVNYPAAM